MGSHLYGNEVLAGFNLFSMEVTKFHLRLVIPPQERQQLEDVVERSRDGIMDEMEFSQNTRQLLNPMRSLEEVMKFYPVFLEMQKNR